MAGLDEVLDELEDKLRRTADQFEPIARRRAEVADEIKNFTNELDKVKHTASELHQCKAAALEEVVNVGEERTRTQSNVQHWETKMAEEQTRLQVNQHEVDETRQEFERTLGEATDFCARVQTYREKTDIEREITAVEKALEERERRGGASVEDMQIEVDRTQAALRTLTQDLAELDALVEVRFYFLTGEPLCPRVLRYDLLAAFKTMPQETQKEVDRIPAAHVLSMQEPFPDSSLDPRILRLRRTGP